ncbi:MAG: hypothetical protein Q4A05_04805 [Ruminococcus sp.]|nr:hypothetical protein [Ruminococcus sp.]
MAAGDSWAEPIVVDNWDDFVAYNADSAYNNKYMKFANPSREITGSGIQTDPFIVSTYDELFAKTGASHAYQCELVNAETQLYMYNDIFCQYDSSLTTIDFNNTEFPSTALSIRLNIDFNGWTLANIERSVESYPIASFDATSLMIKGLILKNFVASGVNNIFGNYAYYTTIDDSVINVILNSTNNNGTLTLSAFNVKNSSVSIMAKGNSVESGMSSNKVEQTNIYYDVDVKYYHTSYDFNCCYAYGKLEPTVSSAAWGDDITDCIINFESSRITASSYQRGKVAVNDDKIVASNWQHANIIHAANEAQLFDKDDEGSGHSWLYNNGFLIGG